MGRCCQALKSTVSFWCTRDVAVEFGRGSACDSGSAMPNDPLLSRECAERRTCRTGRHARPGDFVVDSIAACIRIVLRRPAVRGTTHRKTDSLTRAAADQRVATRRAATETAPGLTRVEANAQVANTDKQSKPTSARPQGRGISARPNLMRARSMRWNFDHCSKQGQLIDVHHVHRPSGGDRPALHRQVFRFPNSSASWFRRRPLPLN
jgi:hypothetical protein